MKRQLIQCKLGWLAAAVLLAAQMAPMAHAGQIDIRRTTDGIPHVRAENWHDVGFGYGYVQAQDALCTMADGFLTYEGRRSAYFGPDAKPEHDSTLGKPTNLQLDLFFRAYAGKAMLTAYRQAQPLEFNQMIDGFAQGYNRYLADARGNPAKEGQIHSCLGQPWVHPISHDDIFRRMFAANIAGGYAHFIPEIVDAHPGSTVEPHATAISDPFGQQVGDRAGIGSNVLAFGQEATGEKGGVLFGNPHWYWGGPDRFYQAQLTIPGKLDVAGASFLGIPVMMIGFNQNIAWSHTVSEARRFGIFELKLKKGVPETYLYDGKRERMTEVTVVVPVKGEDGKLHTVKRKLFGTRLGPMLDLGGRDPAFGWSDEHALAIRDVNTQNFRIFSNYFYWNQARSLDDFIAIQKREAATPWVNTVAIGRGDGRVWYGDVGAVPNVPDDQRAACTTALGEAFSQIDAAVPFLDGSRSGCNWRVDRRSVQPGAMPAADMPGISRTDYVANMNDSYWLTNSAHPLEGFAKTLGGERVSLTFRGRYGHHLAEILTHADAKSAEALGDRLMPAVLEPVSYSAQQFKSALLDGACAGAKDLEQACGILRQWDGRATPDSRGALLWMAFWSKLDDIPGKEFFAVPFSASAPLDTPSAPRGNDPRIAQALQAAVGELQKRNMPLDTPLGSVHLVRNAGIDIPLSGGCASEGYFSVTCGHDALVMDGNAEGNSYMQVVRFDAAGPVARTLLAHGLVEGAVDNGPQDGALRRYARQDWLHFPFSEADIAGDAELKVQVLRP